MPVLGRVDVDADEVRFGAERGRLIGLAATAVAVRVAATATWPVVAAGDCAADPAVRPSGNDDGGGSSVMGARDVLTGKAWSLAREVYAKSRAEPHAAKAGTQLAFETGLSSHPCCRSRSS